MASVNSALKDTLAAAESDKLLFSSDLSEKLKQSKLINQDVQSLAKKTPAPNSKKGPLQLYNKRSSTTTSHSSGHKRSSTSNPKSKQGNSTYPRERNKYKYSRKENYSKKRLILNLKNFNESVEPTHFKMESHKTVVSLLQRGSFMASIDIKDAFYAVPSGTSSVMATTYPGCCKIISQALKIQGVPEKAVVITKASLTSSTIRSYDAALKKWWSFNQADESRIFSPDVSNILSFLKSEFDKGLSYSSLNTTRSAISLVLDEEITNNKHVKRFFRGIYKLRPARPKYASTWDPNIVLNYLHSLEDNEDLPLNTLSKKLTVLLALTTGHRMQTFGSIEIKNIKTFKDKVEIRILIRLRHQKRKIMKKVLFEKKLTPRFSSKATSRPSCKTSYILCAKNKPIESNDNEIIRGIEEAVFENTPTCDDFQSTTDAIQPLSKESYGKFSNKGEIAEKRYKYRDAETSAYYCLLLVLQPPTSASALSFSLQVALAEVLHQTRYNEFNNLNKRRIIILLFMKYKVVLTAKDKETCILVM
ncbi:unnamed protein product [Trichogramma brassicae]|uniref:Uncharacterized protein n=1 Tax=Trichogramma brassicae TaxID=86971 RepID=A0A6H5IWX5_9HYME|nr:unnamed protein product [Trichogramma brassicae]